MGLWYALVVLLRHVRSLRNHLRASELRACGPSEGNDPKRWEEPGEWTVHKHREGVEVLVGVGMSTVLLDSRLAYRKPVPPNASSRLAFVVDSCWRTDTGAADRIEQALSFSVLSDSVLSFCFGCC